MGVAADHLPEGLRDVFYLNLAYILRKVLFCDDVVELIVADTVREQLFNRLQDELPYSAAVVTDDITESGRGINAAVSIYVAKESQKGMIIGKRGELIATIKDVARKNLVHFLGERVELDVRVKVEKNWNRKAVTMKRFGLAVSKQ